MLNTVHKKILEDLLTRYIKDTGIGQFSYWGFADWLINEDPDLAQKLIEEQLRIMNQGAHGAD